MHHSSRSITTILFVCASTVTTTAAAALVLRQFDFSTSFYKLDSLTISASHLELSVLPGGVTAAYARAV